jgi:hypothetical protein
MKSMTRGALIGAAIIAGSLSGPAQAQALFLTCLGTGSAAKQSSTDVQASGDDGRTSWGSITSTRDVAFTDEVKIEILRYQGRIRMPRAMLPDIRGGKDGWFVIEKLKMGRDEITGKAALGFFNAPNLRIDRVTGMLSISGKTGNFSARCKSYDPAVVQRAF